MGGGREKGGGGQFHPQICILQLRCTVLPKPGVFKCEIGVASISG